MKSLATATLAALIGSAVLTTPVTAKTVLPLADKDACLGMSAPLIKVTPEQKASLRARSGRPNESGNGLVIMAERHYSILMQRFFIEQCRLRQQGQLYDQRCPKDIIPMQAAIDLIPSAAFDVTKAEFQTMLREVGDELSTLRRETRRACAQ